MAESICKRCFHSYVCEQFNEHRNSYNEKCHFYNDHFVSAADMLERKRGEWEDDRYDPRFVCGVCGKWLLVENATADMNFCPNCGADMRGVSDA